MKRVFSLFLILLFSASFVHAADKPEPRAAVLAKVSLNDLVEEAFKNNPRIKAAKARVEAARARNNLFRSIPDPELEFEYDRIIPSMTTTPGDRVKPMKTIGISQEIPFPTKILLQKKIARREMESLEAEAKETELRVVRELKDAYVSFLVSDKKLDFAKANQAFLGQLAKAAESRYASGRAEQVEYLRAQVEEAKLIGQIGLLEQERIIAHELLASLLDREPGELGDIVVDETWDDVTVSDGQVLALVKSDRPELKSYEALLNKAQSEYSLGKESFLPDVTLKYKRAEGDGSFDRGEWAGSIGVNVPLWFWGKQLNEVREKRADLDAAKAEYAAAEQTAVFEGRSALAKARAARDVVKLYEGGILPRIESAAEVARRTYEAGTANFQEVFDAVQMSKEFQMEYVDALAAYLVAQADLEQAVGGHLPVKEAK